MLYRVVKAIIVLVMLTIPCLAQKEAMKELSHDQFHALIPFEQKIADFNLYNEEYRSRSEGTLTVPAQYTEISRGRGRQYKPGQKPTPNQAKRPDQPAELIEINLVLFASTEDAQDGFKQYAAGGAALGSGLLPSGSKLGEKFISNDAGTPILFTRGRAFVRVSVLSGEMSLQSATNLAEAVARSVEYNLCANSALTEAAPGALLSLSSVAGATPASIIGGNAWVPLDAAKSMGVQITRNPDGGATLTYGNRSLIVTALSRQARQDSASLDIGLPVLLQNDTLILPLTPVAKCLSH